MRTQVTSTLRQARGAAGSVVVAKLGGDRQASADRLDVSYPPSPISSSGRCDVRSILARFGVADVVLSKPDVPGKLSRVPARPPWNRLGSTHTMPIPSRPYSQPTVYGMWLRR